MFGGKPRSKFGRFLDKHKISQQDLVRESKVNKTTISRLCQGDAFNPSIKNATKIKSALKRMTNKNIDYDDFWSM
ncbi:helix-turn-helix domain-containing protein [Priestia endophytica]|uniref:Helix-turn-helix n=1 Tax=Priestia endophytica DSM 13796 TaxID=1121089 RepID=A0A1I6C0B0_9BACI|nr:helix-turn-helix transcriptional regulator [Priestia endophytica]KYG33439.1 DNA-binding protein [Priestia endophytica]SFQ86632.1 Helix-turn-helix [Priestia endophytica DSM 13796]